jgi:DNA-binding transcriptional MerR regulator
VEMAHTDILAMPHEEEELTLEALASRAGIHPGQVQKLVEFGLIETVERRSAVLLFDSALIPRLRMIHRLRRDLGINLQGIAVVLDLLEKLRALQRENDALRSRR